MKEIKDIFDQYEQKPREEVWDRLSTRLDAEMPVSDKVVRHGMSTAWKKAAAVIGTIVVVGSAVLVASMYIFGNHPRQQDDNVVEPKTHVKEVVVAEHETSAENVDETVLADNPTAVEPAVVKAKPTPETAPATASEESTGKNHPKQNVRQEVLPANSTLAKQLAADPVLKNLSDGSVDWSMPTHLSIPNLFTPNKDGVNDLFVIEGIEQYSSPKLVVRDKNNRIVYQSTNYQNSWGGDNCPDGVYSYEFTFSYNGIENQATGKVRIIRS